MLGYALIFFLGFLLTYFIDKDVKLLERGALGFFLGLTDVSLVILSIGSFNLFLGVTFIIVETVVISIVYFRKHSFKSLFKMQQLRLSTFEVFLVLILIIAFALKIYQLSGILPATAWDSNRVYLSWEQLAYEGNKIPTYELGYCGSYPVVWGAVNIAAVSFLYWFNGGVNYFVAYSLSAVASIVTSILAFYAARRYLSKTYSLIVAAAVTIAPFIFMIVELPYVEPLSMLCFTAFFYFVFSGNSRLQSLAASMAVLVKYTGIGIVVPSIIYSLKEPKKVRDKLLSLIGLLPSGLWLIRNWAVYGSPMPIVSVLDRVFLPQTMTESINILLINAVNGVSPLIFFYQLFFSDGLAIAFTRGTLFATVIILLLWPKIDKYIKYGSASFLSYTLFQSISGQIDLRHFTTVFFLPVFAAFYFVSKAKGKLFNLVVLILALASSISFFPLFVFDESWVFDLTLYFFIVVILYYAFRNVKKAPSSIKIKLDEKIVAIPILLLVLLQVISVSYSTIATIESVDPNGNGNALGVAKFISTLPKTSSYYLICEDPSTRIYVGLLSGTKPNYYEAADQVGNRAIQPLFDKPGLAVNVIFFGSNPVRNQALTDSNYTNEVGGFSNLGAANNTVSVFTEAYLKNSYSKGEYYLIIYSKGNYAVEVNDVNVANVSSDSWVNNVFTTQLSGETTISFASLGGAYFNHLIIASKSYFDSQKHVENLKASLNTLDIRYVICEYGISGTWLYDYYSVFTYAEIPNCLFKTLYSSDWWKVLEVIQ